MNETTEQRINDWLTARDRREIEVSVSDRDETCFYTIEVSARPVSTLTPGLRERGTNRLLTDAAAAVPPSARVEINDDILNVRDGQRTTTLRVISEPS